MITKKAGKRMDCNEPRDPVEPAVSEWVSGDGSGLSVAHVRLPLMAR